MNGRDLAGVVGKTHKSFRRIKVGDVVFSPWTDYRDIRKPAFQEYVISTEHNSARVPGSFIVQASAAIGVAFVTAALALEICCGVNFAGSGSDYTKWCARSPRMFSHPTSGKRYWEAQWIGGGSTWSGLQYGEVRYLAPQPWLR